MRRFLMSVLLTGLAQAPGPAIAEAAPAAAAPGKCSKLAAEYDQIEKSLAMIYADGVGDNSAPRETNRQMRAANDMARASIVVTLLQANRCSLPDHAPSMARYFSPALTCSTDQLKTPQPESCKMENWQPKN